MRHAIDAFRKFLVALGAVCLISACGGGGADDSTSSSSSGSTEPAAVLTVTQQSATSVGLTWTNPADQYIMSPVDVYSTIFRNGTQIAGTHGCSYIDNALEPQTRYSYEVVVTATYFFISFVRQSWGSNVVAASTLADREAPSVPTQVVAAGLSSSAMRVTWSASTDNHGVAVYQVFRDGSPVGTSASTSFEDSGLSSSTSYAYTVSARDPSGNESVPSAPSLGNTLAESVIVDVGANSNSMALDSTGRSHLVYTRVDSSSGHCETRHATTVNGSWVLETIDSGWGYASVAIDKADRLHVATNDSYITDASGVWTKELLPDHSRCPSIAIDPSGAATVSYLVETTGTPRFLVRYASRVAGSWLPETVDTPPFCAYPALGWSSGGPHLAYCWGYAFGPFSLCHVTPVSGAWSKLAVAGSLKEDGTEFLGLRPSLTVTTGGQAHVAVRNVYASNVSGSWQAEIYDAAGMCPAVALNPSGSPCIAYKVYDPDTGSYRLKMAVRSPGGWTRSPLAIVNQPAAQLALAIDATGALHISYCDGRVVYIRVP